MEKVRAEREERRKGRGREECMVKAADVIERIHTDSLGSLPQTSVEVEATDGPPADMAQDDSPETIEVHSRHTLHITTPSALLLTCCMRSYS